MLGEKRSATLTVVHDGPAEVLEVSFASLTLLVHASREPCSFAAQYVAHVRGVGQRAGIRVALGDEDEALLPCARQVLRAQCRRGIMACQYGLPRLLQVLLASMQELSKFQTPLKLDVEVQTQATLITLHLVTKFPYALTVYRSGIVVPILRLLSSRVFNVSRNAASVIEGLTMNQEVCDAIGQEHLGDCEESDGSGSQKIGDLLIGCVLKRIQTVAADRQCDKAMLNSFKALVHHVSTRGIVFAQMPGVDALRLLQAALGHDQSVPDGVAHTVFNTPEVINTVMSIMESYINFDQLQSSIVMLSEEALTWLGKVAAGCNPPDTDVTRRYSRLASRGRSSRSSPTDVDESAMESPLAHSPSIALIYTISRDEECAKRENMMFNESIEEKRRRFDRLLQIAHVQAEEEWNSNIKWIMRGAGRKPSETIAELEMWYENRNKSQMETMEEGISSALLRLGGGDVDKEGLRVILRRIHDAVLLQIQNKEARDTLVSNLAQSVFSAGGMLKVMKAKRMFKKAVTEPKQVPDSRAGESTQGMDPPGETSKTSRLAANAPTAMGVEESEHSMLGTSRTPNTPPSRRRAPPTPGSKTSAGNSRSPPRTPRSSRNSPQQSPRPKTANQQVSGAPLSRQRSARRFEPQAITPRNHFKAAGEAGPCASGSRSGAHMRAMCERKCAKACQGAVAVALALGGCPYACTHVACRNQERCGTHQRSRRG